MILELFLALDFLDFFAADFLATFLGLDFLDFLDFLLTLRVKFLFLFIRHLLLMMFHHPTMLSKTSADE